VSKETFFFPLAVIVRVKEGQYAVGGQRFRKQNRMGRKGKELLNRNSSCLPSISIKKKRGGGVNLEKGKNVGVSR